MTDRVHRPNLQRSSWTVQNDHVQDDGHHTADLIILLIWTLYRQALENINEEIVNGVLKKSKEHSILFEVYNSFSRYNPSALSHTNVKCVSLAVSHTVLV